MKFSMHSSYLKIALLSVGMLLLNACVTIQVLETKAPGLEKEDYFIYENNDLRIQYHFFHERGVLAFEVFNKTGNLLYIDWKKSFYIFGKERYPYWLKDQYRKLELFFNARQSKLYIPGFKTTAVVSPKRIAFIPPNARIFQCRFHILPSSVVFTYSDFEETDYYLGRKKIMVREAQFSSGSTPLQFINYLTYSYSKQFNNEKHVANKFHISKIHELKKSQFFRSDGLLNAPFVHPTSFFIEKR